jgi:Copper transport outer membrane protein, MctB
VFDLRYHVASLTAVFFALVIGILVGVALASHGLGNTERKRLERAVDDANRRAVRAEDTVAALTEDGSVDAAFVDKAYKAVMTDRLQGKRIAVLFVGKVNDALRKSIKDTVTDGGGASLRLRALNVPVDEAAIDGILDGHPQLAAYAGHDNLGDLGRALADEFVLGGDTPLWDALQDKLVEERSGNKRRTADGVVIVRTAQPQADGTARFLHGLFRGLADSPVPVVGVEASDAKPSAVPTFRSYSTISTVDDIDKAVGRVALALLLADAPTGSYGVKKTATDVLPDVVPVSTGSGG